ncbi:MAG TPA: biotin/lipoyl-containing protein, partial [Nitrospira sp.]|nr:biotin/lipoyl-containing protein [Nitrospira sp.]
MATAFKLPDPGEGIHEAEIVEVCVSKGDKVREGDIVLYIETDKATVEVPSPITGAIEDIRVQTGDIVQVGEVLITFTDEMRAKPETTQQPETGPKANLQRQEEAAPEQPASGDQAEPDEAVEHDEQSVAAKQDEPIATETDDTSTARPVPASPATRRLARELGVRLHDVNGSGPGGRVIAEDVRAAAGTAATEPAKMGVSREARPSAATWAEREEQAPAPRPERPLMVEHPPLPDFSRWGPVEAIPLRSVRRATATQMALAWSQIPHVMHQDVADITEL